MARINDPKSSSGDRLLETARGIMTDFVSRRRGNTGPRRPHWEPGKNPFRIFPGTHIVNEWDALRDPKAYGDKVGESIPVLAIPIIRYFLGGKGGRAVNGHAFDFSCPLYRAYCETPREERNQRERPQLMFLVNAMDMRRAGEGIKPVLFTESEWLGQKDAGGSGNRRSYGILHMIAGYPLKKENGDAPAEGGEEEDAVEMPGGGGLRPFAGYGVQILGAQGQDVVIFKKWGKVGGGDALLLDLERRGGPIGVVPKRKGDEILCVDVPDSLVAQMSDLYLIQEGFPGWASDGRHIDRPSWAPEADVVGRFVQAIELAKRRPLHEMPPVAEVAPTAGAVEEEELPGNEPDDVLVPGEAEPAAPAAEPKAGKPRLERGQDVAATDPESGFLFIGKVHNVTAKMVEVVLSPDDQPEGPQREAVESAIKAQKTNVFVFPKAQVAVPA